VITAGVAYEQCEEITRREAKNFSYGIRLLRLPERQALSAVYAMARRIDDIGDSDAPSDEKLAALARVRIALAEPPDDDDPVLVALADAARCYPLPMDAFGELIDGCEMDVAGTRYDTFEDLLVYCRRVAGTIGRLSLAIFGCRHRDQHDLAVPLADDLGVALQLTNILRDVLEDRAMGRIYLPAADADSVGCPPDLSGSAESIAALVALECRRAREWFESGWRLLPLLDHRGRACVGAMAGIYRSLLTRIEHDPVAVTQGRLSVPTWQKTWIALSSLSGMHR
jgi:phytoene synthase